LIDIYKEIQRQQKMTTETYGLPSDGLPSDLYFTNIHILPTAINALVCKSWHSNIIKVLQKQKQTFYELQIYNLIVNKYSDFPRYKVRRRLDFVDNRNHGNNMFEDNIFNIAYDNMIKNIFTYLKADTVVFLNIKESLILYYTKYISIHHKYCRMELLDILEKEYIDKDIAHEYKEILLKYYKYVIT
jgi:hypothetical protein